MDMDPETEAKDKCIAWGPGYLCGFRTYSIALLIIIGFVIIAFLERDVDKLYQAALLVLGFFFGAKVTQQQTTGK